VSRWAIAKDARLGPPFRIVEIKGARFRRHFLVIALKGPESHGPAAEFRSFVLARTALKPAGGFAQGESAKGR